VVLGHTVWKNGKNHVEKRFCVWKNDIVKWKIVPGRNTPINQILNLFFFCQILSANKKKEKDYPFE
jgi:hypothetical protein